jgi:hypothetical protein
MKRCRSEKEERKATSKDSFALCAPTEERKGVLRGALMGRRERRARSEEGNKCIIYVSKRLSFKGENAEDRNRKMNIHEGEHGEI